MTVAQITFFNPKSVSELEQIARNVEQGRELLHKSKPDINKNKRVNAIQQMHTSNHKQNKGENKSNDKVLEAITKLNESLNAFSINKNFKENDKFRSNYSNNKGLNNYSYNKSNKNPYFGNYKKNTNQNSNFQNRNYSQNYAFRQNNNANNGSNYSFKFRPKIQCFRCKLFGHKQNECRVSLNESNAKVESNEEKVSANVNVITDPRTVSSIMHAMSIQLDDSMIMINVEVKKSFT